MILGKTNEEKNSHTRLHISLSTCHAEILHMSSKIHMKKMNESLPIISVYVKYKQPTSTLPDLEYLKFKQNIWNPKDLCVSHCSLLSPKCFGFSQHKLTFCWWRNEDNDFGWFVVNFSGWNISIIHSIAGMLGTESMHVFFIIR